MSPSNAENSIVLLEGMRHRKGVFLVAVQHAWCWVVERLTAFDFVLMKLGSSTGIRVNRIP